MNILDIAIAKKLAGGGGGSGTDNYNDLSNLPKINDTTLSGNKSSSALGLQSEINSNSKLSSDLVDDENKTNKFVTSTEKQTWNSKQNAIDADHKINADYVDDSTSTNKFVTSTEKNTWNAKQNAIDSDHKLSSDLVDDANKTNKFVTSTEKNTWNAKQNAIDADHKLSSSLVSFTEAEAAALASGINSSKVGQISTNQTNILYGKLWTKKNLLKLNLGADADNYGLNFTSNSDGSLVVTGQMSGAPGNLWAPYICDDIVLPAGTYVLCGCPSGGGESTYQLDIVGFAYYPDQGSGVEFTLASPTTVRVRCRIAQTTAINKTFYPMLCEKEVYDADPSFECYGAPNYDLTYLEAQDRASLAEVVDSGAKNLVEVISSDIGSTSTNVTVTVNSDKSIKITGNGSAVGTLTIVYIPVYIPAGTYVLSGCPSGGSYDNGYSCDLRDTSNSSKSGSDVGNGVVFTLSSGGNYRWCIRLAATYTIPSGGVTFKPMVCTKAAFGVSQKFVPYRAIPQLTELNKRVVVPITNTFTKINDLSFVVPGGYTATIFITGFANVTSVTGLKCITVGENVEYGLVENSSTTTRHGLSTSFMLSTTSDITVDVYIAYAITSASATDGVRLLVQYRKTP